MKTYICALAFFIIPISAVKAANWVEMGTYASETENSTYKIDTDSISRKEGDKNISFFWLLTDFSPSKYDPLASGLGSYFSSKTYIEIDCKNSKTRPLDVFLYKEKGGRGPVIRTYHNEDNTWQVIPPETHYEEFKKLVCNRSIWDRLFN